MILEQTSASEGSKCGVGSARSQGSHGCAISSLDPSTAASMSSFSLDGKRHNQWPPSHSPPGCETLVACKKSGLSAAVIVVDFYSSANTQGKGARAADDDGRLTCQSQEFRRKWTDGTGTLLGAAGTLEMFGGLQ